MIMRASMSSKIDRQHYLTFYLQGGVFLKRREPAV